MAGLGVGDRRRHGVLVADLADQDAVWRLAQRVFQRDLEIQGVGADFALVDDAFLVGKNEFHRILQREDMAGLGGVAQIEQGGERRRFARARGAHHQNQAALFHDHFLQHRRHAQGVDVGHLAGDVAHHYGRRRLLAKGADAKAADSGQGKGGVELKRVLEFLLLLVGEDFVEQVGDVGRIHHLLIDRHGGAVDLDVDRRTDREKDVGGLLFRHQLEQTLHRRHYFLPLTARARAGWVGGAQPSFGRGRSN